LLWSVFLLGTAQSQETPKQSEALPYGIDRANVPVAIARVEAGEFSLVDVDLIARANAIKAIPSLKKQFDVAGNPLVKAKIAAALLRMRDQDDVYWKFLVEFTNPALQSDAPDYNGYDQQGKAVPGPSLEFRAWAKAHNVPADAELDDSVKMASLGVMLLGWSQDGKAIPILRKALWSPNHSIEALAAAALAEIGDKESIPSIIEACKRAPAEPAAGIAESLVYFDDVAAQNAVDQFVPEDVAKSARKARANGDKPTSLSAPLRSAPSQ
jgi:hypothetical protein